MQHGWSERAFGHVAGCRHAWMFYKRKEVGRGITQCDSEFVVELGVGGCNVCDVVYPPLQLVIRYGGWQNAAMLDWIPSAT